MSTFKFSSSFGESPIPATQPTSYLPKIGDTTGKDRPSLGNISFTPNVSLQNQLETQLSLFSSFPSSQTTPKIAGAEKEGKDKYKAFFSHSFQRSSPSFGSSFGEGSTTFGTGTTGTMKTTGAENVDRRPLFGNSFASSTPNRSTHPLNSHLLNPQSSIDQPYSKPSLTQIAKINYLDFLIGIFTDASEKNPNRFFFEPVVLLEPKITAHQTHGLLLSGDHKNQNYLCLTIHMWSLELRSKVLGRLKSLPNLTNLNIQEDDVCVIPFEEVKLLCDPSKSLLNSIKVTDRPISYLRSQKSLNFYLICDSSSSSAPSSAQALAGDFQRNPEFMLSTLQLELECKGLCFGAASTNLLTQQINRPTFKFNIASLQLSPKNTIFSPNDFKDQMRALQSTRQGESGCCSSSISHSNLFSPPGYRSQKPILVVHPFRRAGLTQVRAPGQSLSAGPLRQLLVLANDDAN